MINIFGLGILFWILDFLNGMNIYLYRAETGIRDLYEIIQSPNGVRTEYDDTELHC